MNTDVSSFDNYLEKVLTLKDFALVIRFIGLFKFTMHVSSFYHLIG